MDLKDLVERIRKQKEIVHRERSLLTELVFMYFDETNEILEHFDSHSDNADGEIGGRTDG